MEKATYSPEDNKIRIYSAERLSPEVYARVKAAGFSWAPKQGIFVAPMWTPERADLAEELAGELGDEDTSLTERAETRADRFDEYHEKRAADSARAAAAVMDENIAAHHSERQARKAAEAAERNMARAVKMWETAEYWTQRAAGAIRHAKYVERADVRARRVKKIEADQRKQERNKAEAVRWLALWSKENLTIEQARHIANFCHLNVANSGRGYSWSAWDVLQPAEEGGTRPAWTVDQVREVARAHYPRAIEHAERWIDHCENRLAYERAMLGEQGASHLLEKPKRPAPAPLLNVRKPGGVEFRRIYSRNETEFLPLVEMTKAEYAAIREDARGVRPCVAGYRVRTVYDYKTRQSRAVFLTDSKEHAEPGAPPTEPMTLAPAQNMARTSPPAVNPTAQNMAEMKKRLAAGVSVVVAPQLFPTPREIAERMAELADVQPGARVLEPSAGTGRLLGAMGGRMFEEPGGLPYRERDQVHAVEINKALADRLAVEFPLTAVHCADFLEVTPETLGAFDRIIMNPPFKDGADIKHIEHARRFLKPGGVLVALCADGTRQRARLQPLADTWEELPPGSFASEGTSVNVALLTIGAR